MTSVVRHLKALLVRETEAFFMLEENIDSPWNARDEAVTGEGIGGDSIVSRGDVRGADMPEWISEEALISNEQEKSRGGGFLSVCSQTGYMEDMI